MINPYGDDDEEDKRVDRDEKKIATRQQGIHRAATKLSKEKVEILLIRSLAIEYKGSFTLTAFVAAAFGRRLCCRREIEKFLYLG